MSLFILSLWSVSSAVRITHDEKGVSFFHDVYEPMNASLSRRLISGSASSQCASTGGYSTDCISTNPRGCGCEALTVSEKREILDLHNARRDMAAGGIEDCALDSVSGEGATKCPAATDMNYLFWDPALEALSTFWAHQCIWDHHSTWNSEWGAGAFYLSWYDAQPSLLENTRVEAMYGDECAAGNCKAQGFDFDAHFGSAKGWIGENLAAATNGGGDYAMDDILEGIGAWYDESADFVWSSGNSRPEGGVVGHWTQGVWAKSRYLGCGYAICPGGASSPWGEGRADDWLNFVCKYYPGGNFNGNAPYTATADTSNSNTNTNSRRQRTERRQLQIQKDEVTSEGVCSACDADRQGCVSSPTPFAEPQNALCGGPQCARCAVDFNQNSCEYGFASCPSTIFTNDGTDGPAMHPTSRAVAFSGEPTLSPTAPTTAQPTPDAECPLESSGFSYGGFDGEWTRMGEHDGKSYYRSQNERFYVVFSDFCGQFIITFAVDTNSAYCRCEPLFHDVLSTCTWNCWDGITASATMAVNCGAMSSNSAARAKSVVLLAEPQLMKDDIERLQIDTKSDIDGSKSNTSSSVFAWISTSNDVDGRVVVLTVSLRTALLFAAALVICVALLMMARRVRKCRESEYAKVQMVGDSEEITHTEAEEILHVSD